jgi:hypothetical protein
MHNYTFPLEKWQCITPRTNNSEHRRGNQISDFKCSRISENRKSKIAYIMTVGLVQILQGAGGRLRRIRERDERAWT